VSNKPKNTYHIITFGCQMNKNDSERIVSLLDGMGLCETAVLEKADVILMNSCSVRQSAEDRVYSMTHRIAKIKKKNPDLIVCLTGCMIGRDKDGKIQKRLHGVDLAFSTQNMIYLPKWLGELNPAFRSVEDLKEDYLALHPTVSQKTQAFVTIQTGCNHFCTYCVVPFARGLEQNRPLKQILDEVTVLAKKGYLEITLLGQIVNHYIAPDSQFFSSQNPYKESDFAKLLWELNQIKGIERIHYTAPHPIFMTDEVIDALTLPKQLNYLHIPVQSGNSDVLKKMNRRHTREFFIETIQKIKKKKPDIAIGTDIIVGFCGETEEQFQDTVSLYDICDFDISYHAQYSERSGTLAAKSFSDDVSRKQKKQRWRILQDMMTERVLKKNQKYVGQEVSVLVDKCQFNWCEGNSKEMKRVRFRGGEDLFGKIISVRIDEAQEWMLVGEQVK
jgi:tRNA-2-methylthio-N6-dimethylallyladenosine synthase